MNQFDLAIKTQAFIGGICSGRGLVHYELHDRSIDKEKFWSYCLALKKKMGKRPWVLYLDNFRVHTSEDSIKFLDEEDIPCIWAPIYSPEYNPIELYFS